MGWLGQVLQRSVLMVLEPQASHWYWQQVGTVFKHIEVKRPEIPQKGRAGEGVLGESTIPNARNAVWNNRAVEGVGEESKWPNGRHAVPVGLTYPQSKRRWPHKLRHVI